MHSDRLILAAIVFYTLVGFAFGWAIRDMFF